MDKIITATNSIYKIKAFVAEVKCQKKSFKPQLLDAKIEVLKTKELNKYDIESACLDITDM